MLVFFSFFSYYLFCNINNNYWIKSKLWGFFPTTEIRDFPIRGRQVFMHISRRKWYNATLDKNVTRDWELLAKGTKMTNEFATFLKEFS